MCAYFPKASMRQAAKEAMKSNLSSYEQMKSIARAYITKRKCSVQEAVYHVMPELWLRKTFPAVVFINTNLPGKRYRIIQSEDKLSELPEDSNDVFKRNMLDRYFDRPNKMFKKGKYSIVDTMCYAEFCAHYRLSPLKFNDLNDNLPEILDDQVIEENHSQCGYPSTLPLMSSKKKQMKCRKVKSVLRYHVPSCDKKPEEYTHHMLFMYYPFRLESELFESGSYMQKLCNSDVISVVNTNKLKIEPFGDLVDAALNAFHTSMTQNQDSYSQQENDEVENLIETAESLLPHDPEDKTVVFDENDSVNIASLQSEALMQL